MLIRTTRHVAGHETLENEWYVVIMAYKLTIFEILRLLCIITYCVSALTLHIESTDSILNKLKYIKNVMP